MAITTNTDDLDIIAALDDEPNDTGGLTAAQLKAKFDEAANTLQTWINGTHIPELDADHLPYIYGVATTIKETIEGIVLGTIPDDSLTFTKIDSDDVATEAEAQAGTANNVFGTPLTVSRYVSYILASQAQAEAGTDNTKLMTPLRTAQAISALGLRVETGSYSGTGTYGSGNPNSITFSNIVPKFVVIWTSPRDATTDCSVIGLFQPASSVGTALEFSSSGFPYMYSFSSTSLSSKTLSWYSSSHAGYQMNISGYTYYYVGIG